jgi:hypothetical protein
MGDQWNGQGDDERMRESETEQVRGRADEVDEFDEVTEDQDDEDIDDEEDGRY